MASRYGKLTHAKRLVRRVQRKSDILGNLAWTRHNVVHRGGHKGSSPRRRLAGDLQHYRRMYDMRKSFRS